MINQISSSEQNNKTLINNISNVRKDFNGLRRGNSLEIKAAAKEFRSRSLSQNFLEQNKNIALNQNTKEGQPAFKGPLTMGLGLLRGINNSPALGACAVDLCSMVIPRTAIELKNRGKQAGIEAAFREGGSCLVHACIGLIGLLASVLISGKFNSRYNVKAQSIFASGDTIRNMANMF